MATRAQIIDGLLKAIVRPELTEQAETFWLPSAEGLINDQLRVNDMIKRAVFAAESYIVSVPDDFAQQKSLNMNSAVNGGPVSEGSARGALDYMPSSDLDDMEANFEASWDYHRPTNYTVDGKELRLFPRVGFPMQLEMVYYANVPPLVNDTDENWLSKKFPELYLDAMRIFAHRYLLEFQEADSYEGVVMNRILTMNVASEVRQTAGSRLIMQRPPSFGANRRRR